MIKSTERILAMLMERYPKLKGQRGNIEAAFEMTVDAFRNDGRLYICGNGGSAADALHIVGELMKSFAMPRALPADLVSEVFDRYPGDAHYLVRNLQGALPAYSLTGNTSFSTAFENDVCPDMVFAQQVNGYMKKVDILWGLTTSGNSKNVINAFKVANAKKSATVALTGRDGGEIKNVSKVTIMVPETETYKIQEMHLPVYHTICLMLENEFFSQTDSFSQNQGGQ